MSVLNSKLPKVNTRKEFMDYLESIIHPPKRDEDYSTKGRLRELKTYILESNEGFPAIRSSTISCDITDTGLDTLKILRIAPTTGNTLEFFLDTSDDRFFILHTNDKSEDTNKIIETLTKDYHHTFDHTWFYSDMLKHIAQQIGNTFKGFGVSYSNKFLLAYEDENSEIEDLNLSISGSMAKEMQELIKQTPAIERATAYNKIQILRGFQTSVVDSIQDDIHNTGYFAVKRGKSVQDHLQLVDITKNEYAKTIKDVEDHRIGVRQVKGRTLVEGKSFDFEFHNKIENLNLFVERMFDSTMPFKLWGIKSEIYPNYLKIMAVDLHTGSPMDFEIADDMMRVYLFKGNCGNTILRLFTNLQIYYDSKTSCRQLS